MKRLSDGDKTSFETIYAQTCKMVYYIALSILKERDLAEDAMQSAYFNVVKNAGQYKDGTSVLAWIAKIARNEALKLKRTRVRESYVDETENADLFGTGQADDYGLLIDMARKLLAEDEFAVLLLVVAQGYKRKEIAEMLDMPISTVTWKYNNAINKMREALRDR